MSFDYFYVMNEQQRDDINRRALNGKRVLPQEYYLMRIAYNLDRISAAMDTTADTTESAASTTDDSSYISLDVHEYLRDNVLEVLQYDERMLSTGEQRGAIPQRQMAELHEDVQRVIKAMRDVLGFND